MHKEQFRLFLLEDDDNDAYLIERALERSSVPCDLTRFHEPTAAIKVLENLNSPDFQAPHLILSDLKMPKMSGLEFVQWLRNSRYSCIPVIMLSGSSLPEDILSAYRSGTNSFTTKPVDVRQLDEIVATVLKYWRQVCQTPAAVVRGNTHLCGGK